MWLLQVRRLGESSDIVYLSYQGKLGVCARDLCLLRSWQQTADGSTVLVAHSIECEDVPRVAGKVRAECHDCAYMVSPAEDGCIFSYVIQLDMKGYVVSLCVCVCVMCRVYVCVCVICWIYRAMW